MLCNFGVRAGLARILYLQTHVSRLQEEYLWEDSEFALRECYRCPQCSAMFGSSVFKDSTNWAAPHQILKLPALCWEIPEVQLPFSWPWSPLKTVLKLHSGFFRLWYLCKTLSFMPAQHSDLAFPLYFWCLRISCSYSKFGYVGFFVCVYVFYPVLCVWSRKMSFLHPFSSL